jgi:hypothetical protein
VKGNISFHDNSDDNMPFHDSDDSTDEIREMPATQMSSSAYCDYLQLLFPKTPAAVYLAAL